MDEKNYHINKRLNEQLPNHSPGQETWQQLSAKLDAMDAETVYQEQLQGLPVHTPDQGTWNVIYGRLTRIAYFKTGIRTALSVAAGILLFFTISRITDTDLSNKNIQQLAKQEQLTIPPTVIVQAKPIKKQVTGTPVITIKPGNESASRKKVSSLSENLGSLSGKAKSEEVTEDNNLVVNNIENKIRVPFEAKLATTTLNTRNIVSTEIPVPSADISSPLAQNNSVQIETPLKGETVETIETKSILFQKDQYSTAVSASVKQYSPPVPISTSNKNHVALGMNYLPENIYNGTDNSLFHNIDLTASYNKEKVRFNTSLGMAYNEEQLEFDMSYDINTPVTAYGPGGKVDTLGYNLSNMESEYMGTEKHKYVTYNLGFGRRIFTTGKFSTWFNAGAGFGVQLSNPDLIMSTANSVKNQYNAHIVSVKSSTPVYNDVNVNFVTAIDFNYKILKKLSVSFTPTSRWYFKPVLSLNNQATDELTLGFRTGLKFEF